MPRKTKQKYALFVASVKLRTGICIGKGDTMVNIYKNWMLEFIQLLLGAIIGLIS